MCILCVIQKWSRRVATMLPWLVIPLIGLWALSQLLPPAFRFEITSPRLACVFVLLVTLFWYEILMPQLSAWRVRRNARLRERKRFEAIEMQKLRKTAMRRCRNCLTPYRDQNPGGGRFMCSYCGHISKRPVLDLPVPPGVGLSNNGILKDLVGKSGKILNGKVWSDNGWMCGQDWLDNGNWMAGSFAAGKSSYWGKNNGGYFGNDVHFLAEKSYSRVVIFAYNVLTSFLWSIMWIWRKVFRISSSGDDASDDEEHRGMLAKRGENGGNCNESKGEKARRKAEEKRQARLEKELLEEEERKQREEVARLVEERRRLRDEKTEAEKERGKGLPSVREKDAKKEAEKKRQERKKEKDRGSSKSNSDAEELERRAGKESERNRKSETDRLEHHKTGSESGKSQGTEMGHGFKGATTNNYSRGNAGTRYLDRMRGTFISSSRALTGGSFFGKAANTSVTVPREHKSNGSVDHVQILANRRESSQLDRLSGRSNIGGDDKNLNPSALLEPQSYTAPKKTWQQLFTRSSAVPPSSNTNVISRPIRKSQSEVQSPPFPGAAATMQSYNNPFAWTSGLPMGSCESTRSSKGLPLPCESRFPQTVEAPREFLQEKSDSLGEASYVPDPVFLLGPVSESLDNFQLDRGFVPDVGLENPPSLKNVPVFSEVNRPSPTEYPMSRLRIPDERHASSFLFPSTPKAQEMRNLSIDNSSNANEKGVWQMWNTPLGQDGLGLAGGSASWGLPSQMSRPNNEGTSSLGQDSLGLVSGPSWYLPPEISSSNTEDIQPSPKNPMVSLFKKDDQVLSGAHSPQKVFLGNCQNGGTNGTPMPGTTDDPWLRKPIFGAMLGGENYFMLNPPKETTHEEMIYGSPSASATNRPFEMSPASCWPKNEWLAQNSGLGIGNSTITKPPVGGLFSTPDVQSLWGYE